MIEPRRVRYPWGLYDFVHMLFSLHGATAMFQRVMDYMLALHTEYAAVYNDHVVIFTKMWTQHL